MFKEDAIYAGSIINKNDQPEKHQEKIEDSISPEILREKMQNPLFLPTRDQIRVAFEDSDEFGRFCVKNKIFEFLNKEYVEAFSDYIVERIVELKSTEEKPITILEINAGAGRLAYFLENKLKEKNPKKAFVIATDSGKFEYENALYVEKIRHDEALKKYNPDIVISCWMPLGVDLTKEIRETKSVKEYILIGEIQGCCGDPWKTFGDQHYNPNIADLSDVESDELLNSDLPAYEDVIPPYEKDGFEMDVIDDLSNLQICTSDKEHIRANDNSMDYSYTNSATASFRRKVV